MAGKFTVCGLPVSGPQAGRLAAAKDIKYDSNLKNKDTCCHYIVHYKVKYYFK